MTDPLATGAAPPVRSLKSRAVRGTAWTVGAYAAESVIRLVSNFILAQLFAPGAFALLMIAALVQQGLTMFSDLGIGISIVRHKDGGDRAFLNTAWTIQLMRGVLIWLTACALAWPVARAYGQPVLAGVVPLFCFVAVIQGLYSTKEFTARRELDLSMVTALRVGESVIRFVVTIGWAVFEPTIWAIVVGGLAGSVAHMLGTHLLLRGPGNRPQWDRGPAGEMMTFGRWIFVSTALTFFALQSDKLLLSTLTGLEALGVYAVSFPFAKLPSDIGALLAGAVLFPALAAGGRESPERLRTTLEASRRVTLPAGLAATLGVALLSPWFFRLYKPAYADATWITPMLSAGIWFSILQHASDRAIPVLGTARPLAVANAVALAATLAACALGFAEFGMPGFVAGVGVGCLAGYLVVAWALSRVGLPVFGRDMKYTAVLAAGLALAFGLPRIVPEGQPAWVAPTVSVSTSAMILCIVGVYAFRRTWHAVMARG